MSTTQESNAVVLLWFGKPKLALRALRSIADCPEIDPKRVYAYDNGSELKHAIEIRAAFPQFQHRSAPLNDGYAGGFNGALAWAFDSGHEAALFLTSDTLLTPGALDQCQASARENQADLLAPLLRFLRPPHPIDAWGARFDPESCQLSHDRSEALETRLAGPWGYIPGTALWITRSAFEGLKGVEADYFMYWEDVDLSLRAHRAGLVLARTRAIVYHGGGETCAKKPVYTAFYYHRNRIRFCRTHLEGAFRQEAFVRLTEEYETLFQRWRAHGDSLRTDYIPPLQAELQAW